jgi:hypothetical protein
MSVVIDFEMFVFAALLVLLAAEGGLSVYGICTLSPGFPPG